MTPRFQPDDTLYKRRNTLKVEYVPDDIVGRDNEIEEYEAALQPIINGEYPDNMFCMGSRVSGRLRPHTICSKNFRNQLTSTKTIARHPRIAMG